MSVRSQEILQGVGGDILNPQGGRGAYDDMLRALHDVIGVHKPVDNWTKNEMYISDYYNHVNDNDGRPANNPYANLLYLSWPIDDWEATGDRFYAVDIYGSDPLYRLRIDTIKNPV